jgi:hypothetical protein
MNKTQINIDNYEAWLLDFAEGNLSSQNEAVLRLFVNAHPELNIDLAELDLLYLEDESNSVFDKKALLKKDSIAIEDAEQILFAAIENKTKVNEAEALIAKYPKYATDFEAYKKSILSPDYAITFSEKESLKQSLLVEETTEFKIFEAVEFSKNKTDFDGVKNIIEEKPALLKDLQAYRFAKLSPDLNIKYPNKQKLKKSLFFGFSQKDVLRVAAIFIGVSIFGTVIYLSLQPKAPNNLVANNEQKNKTPAVIKENQNTELVAPITQPEDKDNANLNTNKVASKKSAPIKSKAIEKVMQTPLEIEKINQKAPAQAINFANNTNNIPTKIDAETTVEQLGAEDPLVLAAENTNKKFMPIIVTEDVEELAENEAATAKDPLLYKAANEVNKLLSFIGTRKIPVTKKNKKGNVSYELGQNLLTYNTSKKLKP